MRFHRIYLTKEQLARVSTGGSFSISVEGAQLMFKLEKDKHQKVRDEIKRLLALLPKGPMTLGGTLRKTKRRRRSRTCDLCGKKTRGLKMHIRIVHEQARKAEKEMAHV